MLGTGFKYLAKKSLRKAGYEIVSNSQLSTLKSRAELDRKAEFLGMMADEELRRTLDIISKSPSQLNQDFFVLHELDWKTGGYFVEFGATDGRTLNNTWLLETEFGWNGILAEPSKGWAPALRSSRRTAKIEFDCVWSRSNEKLQFEEVSWGELSTLSSFLDSDAHDRRSRKSYEVNTVSLNDLLDRNDSPRIVDYLSIDTEGSEFEILQAVDFDKYKFRCITCEHNFSNNRENVFKLLTSKGYTRKFETISAFDDWYVCNL
jgi:FkbM family methyltransferase